MALAGGPAPLFPVGLYRESHGQRKSNPVNGFHARGGLSMNLRLLQERIAIGIGDLKL